MYQMEPAAYRGQRGVWLPDELSSPAGTEEAALVFL